MLIGKYQEIQSKFDNKTSGSCSCDKASCCDKVDKLDSDVANLYSIVNNITVDATDECLQRIQDDGVRFGDNWWFGEQGSYLFAIDIKNESYYRFNPNTTTIL